MNRMRQRIAERLKDAQNTNAMLTTFNEVDMSCLIELRKKFQESFISKHGIKLGFMSPFVKAACFALQDQPIVNAGMHTHTHSHTHSHTHTLTHTLTHILTHTHTLTHTHSHTYSHTLTHTLTHTHSHTYSHTHTLTLNDSRN